MTHHTKRPLTRQDLDRMRCATPGCRCGGVVWLHNRCHGEGMQVSYAAGVLKFFCDACDAELSFQVAVLEVPELLTVN